MTPSPTGPARFKSRFACSLAKLIIDFQRMVLSHSPPCVSPPISRSWILGFSCGRSVGTGYREGCFLSLSSEADCRGRSLSNSQPQYLPPKPINSAALCSPTAFPGLLSNSKKDLRATSNHEAVRQRTGVSLGPAGVRQEGGMSVTCCSNNF